MKERKIKKHIASVLKIYLLYAVLTAILVPLPQKEASGTLWQQYEARLDTSAAQERVMTVEDSDSALLLRLQLIESAQQEIILSSFDLRADESGQDVMAALLAASERGVQVRMIVDGLNGFLHLQGNATLRALAAAENVEVRFYAPVAPSSPMEAQLPPARQVPHRRRRALYSRRAQHERPLPRLVSGKEKHRPRRAGRVGRGRT